MKGKILIVDDEPLARLRIRKYLTHAHPEIEIAEAEDGFEALARIGEFAPDVVFLDIEMPELNGFDVLHHLEHRPFHVVFQTAYNEFAVQAFEINACDYLLKPFTDDRLEKALSRSLGAPASSALKKLDDHLVRSKMFLERIVVNVGSRSKVIEQAEVLYFLSEEHITRVFLDGIDYAYDYSLTFLEERLDPAKFTRIHRNAIVRIDAVASITHGTKAAVTLKNGVNLQVSRERKKQLDAIFGES